VSDDEASQAARQALNRATGPRPSRRSKRSRAKGTSRDPALLGDAIDALLAEQGWQEAASTAALLGNWAQIVGPELADHVTCESFHEGVLQLRASSSAWATQVRLLLPQLRKAIDEAVGQGTVQDIKVDGPQGPSWRAGKLRVKGRGPRDTYG
jgi:predicted nucleic acid-binding Zn ribbon protein